MCNGKTKPAAAPLPGESKPGSTLKFCIIGFLGGAANGLFGAGGGLFLVPLFTRWMGLRQRKAFATSVAVILPLSIVSAILYFMQGALDISSAWPYLAGGLIGGYFSGRLFRRVPIHLLRRVFGLLILYGGIRALLNI